jgi:hypothetical protein
MTRSRRQLPLGPPMVEAFTTSLVAADDDLKAILTWKYGDWIDWEGCRGLERRVTEFLHSFVNGSPDRIKCEVIGPAPNAPENQIRVSLNVSPRERLLFAALRARDGDQVLLHLSALDNDLAKTPRKAE